MTSINFIARASICMFTRCEKYLGSILGCASGSEDTMWILPLDKGCIRTGEMLMPSWDLLKSVVRVVGPLCGWPFSRSVICMNSRIHSRIQKVLSRNTIVLFQRRKDIVVGNVFETGSCELADFNPRHDSTTIHERSISEGEGCAAQRSFARDLVLLHSGLDNLGISHDVA